MNRGVLNTVLKALGALIVILIVVVFGMGNDLSSFIDLPSIIFLAGGIIGGLLLTFGKDFFSLPVVIIAPSKYCNEQSYSKYVRMVNAGILYALLTGLIGTSIGAIIVLGHHTELTGTGPKFAVSFITTFYAMIAIAFVLLPIRYHLLSFITNE